MPYIAMYTVALFTRQTVFKAMRQLHLPAWPEDALMEEKEKRKQPLIAQGHYKK